MEKGIKNILSPVVERINSNIFYAVTFYSVYCLILNYFFWLIEKTNWSGMIFFRSLFIGSFLGLMFRYVIYPKEYTLGKRFRILLLLTLTAPAFFAILFLVMQRILKLM